MTVVDRVQLVVPGVPVPLQRSRTRGGAHYLPRRSRAYRELIQGHWLAAGRPSIGTAPFALSASFYGLRASADLDNAVKAVLDALNTLAFGDDCQLICLAGCHKLPADGDGPRTVIDLWRASRTPDHCACAEPVTEDDDSRYCAKCERPIELERAA
jgi:Holliday junction resolvase RusA-like endonuclease